MMRYVPKNCSFYNSPIMHLISPIIRGLHSIANYRSLCVDALRDLYHFTSRLAIKPIDSLNMVV